MIVPTDQLDYHLNQRTGLLERVRKLDLSVAADIADLQEKLRAGETTGIPFWDWALLAHESEYRAYADAASRVQRYLAGKEGNLIALTLKTDAKKGTSLLSGSTALYVGVLTSEGLSVQHQNGSANLVIPTPAGTYIKYHSWRLPVPEFPQGGDYARLFNDEDHRSFFLHPPPNPSNLTMDAVRGYQWRVSKNESVITPGATSEDYAVSLVAGTQPVLEMLRLFFISEGICDAVRESFKEHL